MEKNSLHHIRGKRYPYLSAFDEDTGLYFRTGILKDGKDTGIDPFRADFPELLDVGIMGSCSHGESGLCQKAGIDCYQSGPQIRQNHMSLDDFRRIVEECRGRTYQFALGGRGDPDQHPDFAEMLAYSRRHGIVPNFTTSGLGMTSGIAELCRKYCGAVAVSWYRSRYTDRAIDILLQAGVRTNVHYVLDTRTLKEAVRLLKEDGFPKGINAVVFLLYKPGGLGTREYIITERTEHLKEFFALIDRGGYPFKIGFDSCTVPGLLRYSKATDPASIDTCEGGRWSAYITPDMQMLPCSFDNQQMHWAMDLRKHTIEEAWNSQRFSEFRKIMADACPECDKRESCMGGCPICPEIVLCGQTSRRQIYQYTESGYTEARYIETLNTEQGEKQT